MSVQQHITDSTLVTTGMVTGIFGLQMSEIDILLGIVLKLVSILSFVILIIYNVKKYRDLTRKLKQLKDEEADRRNL